MKVLFYIPLFISTVICSYLSDLDRTFGEAELKIVDLYVSMPASEVQNLIQIAQISERQVANNNSPPDFKYEEATMVAKWNGQEKTYENVSFKTGGMYARSNDKVGFNIKLEKKFLGRKNIRIRPDPNDRSRLHSKLCCDIANRIGLPSIQATYARLYMNDEYWGLYTLMDAIKPSWIKQTFNPTEKEVTNLYQCKYNGMNLKSGSDSKCVNANDDYPSMTTFKEFVKDINSAKSSEEIEKIMDVDVFLKFMAMEWLIGSFDHFLVLGHNFYFYKRETDGKWVIIEYDYDNTFGNGVEFPTYWMNKKGNRGGNGGGFPGFPGGGFPFPGSSTTGNQPINYSFSEWELDIPIIDTLVHKHQDRFKEIVHHVLVSAFNPTILNDHIEEIKNFLLPYVEEDCVPGSDGRLPGRINKKGNQRRNTVSEFEKDIEDGVKKWIKTKFEVACKNYDFNQDEIIRESLNYTAKSYDYGNNGKNKDDKNKEEDKNKEKCWAEALGYTCCKNTCDVITTDNDGSWGIENDDWCGILESVCKPQSLCYGETTGEYPCCMSCDAYESDENGGWGIENGDWCSIKYSCN